MILSANQMNHLILDSYQNWTLAFWTECEQSKIKIAQVLKPLNGTEQRTLQKI